MKEGDRWQSLHPGGTRVGEEWAKDQFSLRQTAWCGGDGTDRTSFDIAGDIPGHVGPPVTVLEKREGSVTAWVSRSRRGVDRVQKG